jgi:D-inositol-3-phosphate glycosyltransferase
MAASHRERTELAKHYGVSLDKVAVAPAGVDINLFHPLPRAESQRHLNIDAEMVILFVGRIDPPKGVDVLLKAVGTLEGREYVQVVIVGGQKEGDEGVDRLRRVAEDLGIDRQVSFRGPVPQADLPAYYSAADVCVLPSHYETFCLVILESLACGTPVIVTREGCAEEVIRPGENGWLLDRPSVSQLSGLLRPLVQSRGDRERLRTNARSSVTGFTWGLTAFRLAQEYRSLVS